MILIQNVKLQKNHNKIMDNNKATIKNRILIITTVGCEGCVIARRNMVDAIKLSTKEITLDVLDKDDVPKSFLEKQRIRDFPAIVFMNYETVKFKTVGSNPTIVYQRYIDLYCKR